MRSRVAAGVAALLLVTGAFAGSSHAALTVPTDIQQPGTQPGEVAPLERPDQCSNCHADSNKGVELANEWGGSMMAHASRDPIFWATMAIAEQDFDGSGDLCLRCHTTAAWMEERSTPTDGSALTSADADGVECHFCHAMTNPDGSEHPGVMNGDFVASDGGNPPKGYLGSGIAALLATDDKAGPYAYPSDANPPHGALGSSFHRSVDYCGTCHDVSNPAVGDLAHNNGTLDGAPPVVASGAPGGPVAGKAAFNNFPHSYGVVERTFSEYKSGALVETLVSDYGTLPADLKAGAILEARNAALLAGQNGDYADGTDRYFSCQTCHMQPANVKGCKHNSAPVRPDMPTHDLTGGSYWMPAAIAYLDSVGKLRLGGGMTSDQLGQLAAGGVRAEHQLEIAASLSVGKYPTTVVITNLTGHKLISGYPEGRRMWLEVSWYDDQDALLRVDGEYGPLFDGNGQPVEVIDPADSVPEQVETILDLSAPNTKIYQAKPGMTQQWASQLLSLSYPAGMPIAYDRLTGAVESTLGDLAGEPPGTKYESFHFVLNNTVVSDNRIPTWGMRYDDAWERNALPVPADQYGSPGTGGTYEHFDAVPFAPPSGAVRGEVRLLYQSTSWEYIQFLALANDGSVTFLADEGQNMLEAWVNTGMSAPFEMADITLTPEPGAGLGFTSGLLLLSVLARRRARGPVSRH